MCDDVCDSTGAHVCLICDVCDAMCIDLSCAHTFRMLRLYIYKTPVHLPLVIERDPPLFSCRRQPTVERNDVWVTLPSRD